MIGCRMVTKFLLPFGLILVFFLRAGYCDEAQELLPIPDKLVVLTIDDSNKSDRSFVAGVVKKHGFGATFFITEGLGFLKSKKNYTTWGEIAELHAMGFEIGNHTKNHPGLGGLSEARVAEEIKGIEKRCEEHKIPKPVTFCYPGFHHAPHVVKVVREQNYQFARRGVGPEHPDGGNGARGPAYDPKSDHPLLVPTTGYAGPKWGMDDLKWAVGEARDGKIAVLCFHGVPAVEHPWVNCQPEDFKQYMRYLKDAGCTVIAMRDLAKYVDPKSGPKDPYAPIRERVEQKKKKEAAE